MEKAKAKLEIITRYFTALSPLQIQQFDALESIYRDWNGKINLISRKDIDSLYEKHVLHSLSIAKSFGFKKDHQILDIGTGGGFPGIPLAIFFPQTEFLLLDSIGKKIKVVQEVASALGLPNVSAVHSRVEDIRNRQFDCVVSRAVAPLKELWDWSKPLLRKRKNGGPVLTAEEPGVAVNGLISLKGGDLAKEISESRCRPLIQEIFEIFPEEYFRQKFLLFVPR
jgi:16S rRNA (guanine527-N7)-methyltransferase